MIVNGLIIDDIIDTDKKLHLTYFGGGEKSHITLSKTELKGFNGNGNNFYLIDFSGGYSSQHSKGKVTTISECKFENFNLNKSLINIDVTQKLIFFISCLFNNITLTTGSGSIFNSGGDLECYNCEFKFCKSSVRGGVLNHIPLNTDERNLIFTDCLFLNCSSESSGGVFETDNHDYTKDVNLKLLCCNFFNNSCNGTTNQGLL
jgi:hypothetical protein